MYTSNMFCSQYTPKKFASSGSKIRPGFYILDSDFVCKNGVMKEGTFVYIHGPYMQDQYRFGDLLRDVYTIECFPDAEDGAVIKDDVSAQILELQSGKLIRVFNSESRKLKFSFRCPIDLLEEYRRDCSEARRDRRAIITPVLLFGAGFSLAQYLFNGPMSAVLSFFAILLACFVGTLYIDSRKRKRLQVELSVLESAYGRNMAEAAAFYERFWTLNHRVPFGKDNPEVLEFYTFFNTPVSVYNETSFVTVSGEEASITEFNTVQLRP